MRQWFCVRGKQLSTGDQGVERQDILFYLIEASKPKALIAASLTKTLYMLQHPQAKGIEFEFNRDSAVTTLGKDWSPNQLEHDQAIIVIAPYAGNGNQLQILNPSAAG